VPPVESLFDRSLLSLSSTSAALDFPRLDGKNVVHFVLTLFRRASAQM
jgi:hypothetical protein